MTRTRTGGISILEGVMALGVLALVALLLLAFFGGGLARLRKNRAESTAYFLAQRKLAELSSVGRNQLVEHEGTFDNPYERYRFLVEVEERGPNLCRV